MADDSLKRPDKPVKSESKPHSCQTCKTRRIGCDGSVPICRNCTKSKRICIPIPTTKQTNFVFHTENEYATGRNKRPRGPRSSFTVKPASPNLETKALAYYMQYHLQVIEEAPITIGGLSESVAAWKASGQDDVMVDLALASMALAVYANTQNDQRAAEEASSKYYQLLQAVQDRIAKVELPTLHQQDMDACLLTIFLMGRYEGQSHRPDQANPRDGFELLQSWSHHEGAMAILKVWHDRLSRKTASEIVKQTRRGQIRSAIMRSRVLPEWILDGACFGEHGLELDYDRIIVRLILLRQSLACHQQRTDIRDEDVERLNTEAQGIDQALESWMVQMSHTCPRHCSEVTLQFPLPAKNIYSNQAYTFLKLGHAGVWTQYTAARLLTNSTRYKILDLGGPDMLTYCSYRRQRTDCLGHIRVLTDILAKTVPFCLGKIESRTAETLTSQDALVFRADREAMPYMNSLLVWPLTIASSLDEIEPDPQQWFRSELASIGAAIGDNIIATAGTDGWLIVL